MKKTHIELSGLTGCITLAAIASVPLAIAGAIILITHTIIINA